MNGKKILAVIMSAGMMATALAGCGGSGGETPTETSGVNVKVQDAAKRDISKTASYTGELMTSNKAAVTSKVSAKVININAEVGDWVNKGDVLVVLDATDYQLQLEQAQASYKQAQASYNQAQAGYKQVEVAQTQADLGVTSAETSYDTVTKGANEQTMASLEQAVSSATIAYNNAKTNYDRQKQLYDMGAISQAAFESAESTYENARIALDTAKKNYEIGANVTTAGNEASAKIGVENAQASKSSAQAQLESARAAVNTAAAAMETAQVAITSARNNIANTKITATISGYVSARNVSVGQFASPGVALFEINASDNLEAEIQVTEAVIAHVSAGDTAKVSISSSNLDSEGIITVVNPVKNAQTGMYTVRVSVPNTDAKLKIGMFADITLITDESVKDALSVPVLSVLSDDEGSYVYIVQGNQAEKRKVTLGVSDGTYIEVQSGLKAGEKVVVEGKDYISDADTTVNIVE